MFALLPIYTIYDIYDIRQYWEISAIEQTGNIAIFYWLDLMNKLNFYY